MRLYQYWEEPQPPQEVELWTSGFRRDNPECVYHLYNHETALEFIAQHYGVDHLSAFQACAVPAMQADYFRLCALLATGGIYVDADLQSRQPLSGLISQAEQALMFNFGGILNNGLMMFRSANHPFLAACLDLATSNIIHRRFNTAFMSMGPGVINAVRASVEPAALPLMLPHFNNMWAPAADFIELLALCDATERLIKPASGWSAGHHYSCRAEHC